MTYQELQDNLVSWLNREGFTELIDLTPEFIALAERRVARDCDLYTFETVLDSTTSTTDVPSDWMRAKTLTLTQGDRYYEVNGAPHKKVMQAGQFGRPLYYSIINETFYFGPTPDQEYAFQAVYYAKPPPLSDSNTSNWVSENNPELYLWAALLEACLFLKDDMRAQVWEGRYMQLKEDTINSQQRRDMESGALAVRETMFRNARHY